MFKVLKIKGDKVKDEIKKKIYMINCGFVPLGYKKTSVGIVPNEWEESTLHEIFHFKNGLNKEKEAFGKGIPIINYVDVYKNRGLKATQIQGRVELSKKEIDNYRVQKGDVFFTRTSETVDEIGLASVLLDEMIDTVFSGFVLRARPFNNKIHTEYNQYCYSSTYMRNEIRRKSSYTTRALTNGNFLGEVSINLPSKSEQGKISEILMKWDEAISLQEKLIENLEIQKNALMQKLLSPKEEWKEVKIGSVVKEVSRKNKINCKNVMSVSNKYGFIKQEEHFSKRVASEDLRNYKIVTNDDIAYNPSRINVGSIAVYKHEEIGIVSPMYIVFRCTKISPCLLLLILSTSRGKYDIESFLSGSVRNSLNFSDLAEIKIKVPRDSEQKRIIEIFNIIDKRILLYNHKLLKIKEQQKAIMQLLLTGIVRVNKE